MPRTPDRIANEQTPVETDYEAVLQFTPLPQLFGDTAKTRIIRALLQSYPRRLNPNRIVEVAGLDSRTSWYNHRDDLLATGLVIEDENAGNSPLYRLADDDRVEALEVIRDLTAADLRDHSS